MWALVAKIVIAVVAAVASAVVATRSNSGSAQQPATFQDFDFPQWDEGTPIAYVFGDVWSEDWMVIGAGGYMPVQFKVSV